MLDHILINYFADIAKNFAQYIGFFSDVAFEIMFWCPPDAVS